MSLGVVFLQFDRALRIAEGVFTSQETNVFMQCRANCARDFNLGLTAGATVTWLASQKLPLLLRLYLTTGISLFSGIWTFERASNNCVQKILSLEGTRLQKELGALMLKKYRDDPLIMQLVSKYFYSEEVYSDASDRPRLSWRYRNFFTDSYPETSEQKRNDIRTSETSDQERNDIRTSETSDQKMVGLKKIHQDRKKEQMNAVGDAMENPFDCIFGLPESADEPHSDASSKSSTRPVRGNKRSHRRHRKSHQEAAEHA